MNGQEDELSAICSDISSRQRYRRGPKKMSDVLSRLMARRGYAQAISAAGCAEAWQQAVGGELARDSRAGNVRRGVLQIVVRNSVIVQELSFQKRQLIRKLADLVPDQKIRDLKIRVGSVD
jgi:predicted nucleic acid-binding Zn ribbon protein